ncbi:glycosyltransferase family 2 protein [Methylobacter sp.]|uniref:glycosyltransferase family 2 protein n=1 Tax=Methylobacter sp. TaxID=2051955 RepID=UPI002488BB36|nr:glycosyltransferase family 2 protein [Methylobacter sp.]MDI1276641.1 glycosyltransferase family 2 protein [Methylobacter sp.]MDI1357252.1 glycosyltransferase family 2 protein [Methylobacter sp.]
MAQLISSDCDVIIVNYNAGHLLAKCIGSLLPQLTGSIIVVDNASADDSLRLAEDLPAAGVLRIIRNTKNIGFAAACNVGARASLAKSLLFLNPDSTLEPGALRRMIEVLESADDIGMVGGMLCNPDGTEQPGGRRVFPTPGRAFMRAFGLSRLVKVFPKLFSDFLMHKEPLPKEPVAVEAISGACMLVKREAVADVGLWDDRYFLHCEDLDWCMRFGQKGYKIMFVPDAKVIHLWGACSRSRPIFVEWHKHYGMMRFYRKFFRHQYPRALWWLVAVGVLLRFGLVATHYSAKRAGRALGLGRDRCE